jgi:hypothetical protein
MKHTSRRISKQYQQPLAEGVSVDLVDFNGKNGAAKPQTTV